MTTQCRFGSSVSRTCQRRTSENATTYVTQQPRFNVKRHDQLPRTCPMYFLHMSKARRASQWIELSSAEVFGGRSAPPSQVAAGPRCDGRPRVLCAISLLMGVFTFFVARKRRQTSRCALGKINCFAKKLARDETRCWKDFSLADSFSASAQPATLQSWLTKPNVQGFGVFLLTAAPSSGQSEYIHRLRTKHHQK